MFSRECVLLCTVLSITVVSWIYYLIPFHHITNFGYRVLTSHCSQNPIGYPNARHVCNGSGSAAQHVNPICWGCDNLLEFGAESLDQHWKPFNCSMKKYGYQDLPRAVEALRSRTTRSHVGILLIGDSRMRQLQTGLHHFLLGQTNYTEETPPSIFCNRPDANDYHWFNETLQSCEFNRTIHPVNLSLARWWIPFLDAKSIEPRLQSLLDNGKDSLPNVIVLGGGLWLIRDCWNNKIAFSECITYFRRNVTELLPVLKKVSQHSIVLWTLEYPVTWQPLTVQMNRKLAMMNDLLRKDLASSSVRIWESYSQAYDMGGDTPDGSHFGWRGLSLVMQMFLNFIFNMVESNDKDVCCSSQLQ